MRNPLRPTTASEPALLDAYAAQAGLALACAYSSSAELDAELIAARRAAGIYGPKRQRRQALIAAAAVAAGVGVLIILVVALG